MRGDVNTGLEIFWPNFALPSPETPPSGLENRMNAKTSPTVAFATAMGRALELAAKGPLTGGNPRVGCVLLDSAGAILAEGWHEGSGTPHAEIMAMTNARAEGISTEGLTAVVTLEPCSHTGKTGPCAQALVEAGITRVVFSVDDPGVDSSGGAQTLEKAGIEVVRGAMAQEGLALIERWHNSVSSGRPWVSLKWAMSWDGRAAAADGASQWITGPLTREKVHHDRSEHGAIVVGTNTVLVDDPSLTARSLSGDLHDHQPLAVVAGNTEVPQDAKIRSHPGGFRHVPGHDPRALLNELFAKGIRSVYVEGGPTLASAFIEAGVVDEFHITVGPMLIGGPMMAVRDLGVSTMSEVIGLDIRDITRVGDDVVVTARPRSGK
jgi:diaminohydroxyphosphoribosylaminopyrimidine deaminase/5-amino-6-(5-phosphoribosylamino)uracil reductase